MKEVVGYLIDRTTGLGISGKTVSFKDLGGSAISAGGVVASGASTGSIYQSVSSTTDANGRFVGSFELSPGPVNITVDVSGSEKKVRKWDEKAQAGVNWMGDLRIMSEAIGNVVIKNYLSDLAPQIVSGHTYRILKGAAAVGGGLISIDNLGGASGVDIVGNANANAALNPRIDLITLRQYSKDAAGQNAGRQAIVVTEGVSTGVAPATPTGSDFEDLPLFTVSTAFGASTKTIASDLRQFTNFHPAVTVVDSASIDLTIDPTTQVLTGVLIYAGSGGDFGVGTTPARNDHKHTIPVQLNDVTVTAAMNTLDFKSPDFVVTDSPAGEANVALGTQGFLPPGVIMPYAGSVVPTGWYECIGQSLLRATEANLFAAIGTTYGAADGTHFTLPNLKGLVVVGQDTGNVLFDSIGETGGEYSHTLTEAESGLRNHNHTQTGDTITFVTGAAFANGGQSAISAISRSTFATALSGGFPAVSTHNNIQPYMAMKYIIKA